MLFEYSNIQIFVLITGLSPGEIPRAKPEGFPKGSGSSYILQLKSQYRHSQLQLQKFSFPAINIGRVDSPYCSVNIAGQYGKILPSILSNTGEVNFNIIIFSI